jgi:hypothetical protein
VSPLLQKYPNETIQVWDAFAQNIPGFRRFINNSTVEDRSRRVTGCAHFIAMNADGITVLSYLITDNVDSSGLQVVSGNIFAATFAKVHPMTNRNRPLR